MVFTLVSLVAAPVMLLNPATAPIAISIMNGAGATVGTGAATTAGVSSASAAVAAGAAVGEGASTVAAALATVGATAAGPPGWLVGLGAESTEDGITFDCWKDVLHETDTTPSLGMIARDFFTHPSVLPFDAETGTVTNIWGEKFLLTSVVLPSGELMLHVGRI